ncbi:nucleotidyltransferase [Anaerobacillus alkaliphilus]|uniref:tRNA(Met) cytidine acetate ligase n=1 Tax=Anaerobacillus alkaliphilus TaxID=1548597 RepID=A0A4Q0VRU2_9BACI|nr:nucleotidyltransferase [Anaerobacillus alkaliphilus]RXI98120.1 nucleotidyltransferase [Anaerobacillus alkaliphilus]
MNITGVVVEYNPFHNGHALHVNESKKETNADLIIAVMSGNFLQRGEPALVSKWSRTKMALANGVDIVLELPYVYATQHAETFANGAVSILNGIGANAICFGSEAGDIQQFKHLVSYISKNEDTYQVFVQQFLKEGMSYPKALATAFTKMENRDEMLDLSRPNNILGYHYVKAIYEQSSKITPYTIQRTTAQYHDKEVPIQSIASATSIRESIIKQKKDLKTIEHVVPTSTFMEIQDFLDLHNGFQHWERLFPFLKYKILTSSIEDLGNIYEAEEGLEYRIASCIKEATSFQELMKELKTKRYTWTRLQRYCLHILTNTSKLEMKHVTTPSPYIRVLGMNQKGRDYINSYKKQMDVPLISTLSKYRHPFIEIEKRAATCYALGFDPIIQNKLMTQEYAHPPIILKSVDCV